MHVLKQLKTIRIKNKKMTKEEFISLYGREELKATSNFATKALGTNYNIVDTITEFCDNSYDARFEDKSLNFVVVIDNTNHTLTIKDDGKGIANADKLLELGGTDKENRNDSIGKYGVGVEGAISSIASQLVYNSDEMVEVIFSSSHEGKHFEKHTSFNKNGEQIIGKTKYTECDKDEHFTNITFTNIVLNDSDCIDIMSAMEVTFEEPLKKNLNITFNNEGNKRVLGKSTSSTFIGDEKKETVMVGKFPVDVKYRIIGGCEQSKRAFDESGLRIYDKQSGRLLSMNTAYWHWFMGRKAQQNICGLRAAIYIDSSIECYKTFGILSAKNGVSYKKYYNKKCFKDLRDKLSEIYAQACNNKAKETNEIELRGYTFNFSNNKKLFTDKPYKVLEDAKMIMVKKNMSNEELSSIILDIVKLENKISKKSKAKKAEVA